jgi:phage gpG-like protein
MNRTVALLFGRVHEHLDGETLQRRSGELYDSIQQEVRTEGDAIVVGRVFTNSPIASIHERGGTTRPHEIVAVNARALRFVAGKIWFTRDDVVFARRVQHPGSRIPARSFMASSLRECLSIIREIFRPRAV